MIYKFKCKGCGRVHELCCSMNDYDGLKDKETCPECKGKCERVFEAFSGSVKLSSGMYGTGNGGWNK